MSTNQKKQRMLVPQYMQHFSCIGSACEDSCCIGWNVNIDEDTYKKYKRSRNEELKPLFEENIKRQRSRTTKDSFARIKMDNSGRCSFLSEENLCKIQLNLGEEYLSNTCTIYPRIPKRVNNVIEKSATMSCPEAARLALLNPEGIEFDEIEEPMNSRQLLMRTIDTQALHVSNKVEKYFWELRIFTIQLLQNRAYTLDERIIILGLFYQEIQKLVDEKNIHDIPSSIAKYMNLTADNTLKKWIDDIPSQLAIQIKLCKELVDFRFNYTISGARYLECLTEVLNGLHFTEENSIENIEIQYRKAMTGYYKPFMQEHEYILENYLVNNVFKNLFPLEQKTVFEDYVMLVVHYALIKLHLIGMSGFHEGLTTDLVIKLIQSFSKTIEHNNMYLNRILSILKANEVTSMSYMAILIKN
ncbi:flagellin lysine-N-methylase [Lysinibacillus fusiformis]|nr:flagellin lysine-N-methylase [Lysinibacillus fusiformis]QSB07877.1 flagellin lysine-N-methylase [Lysinibacillus fusiformis]